ncbi:hypothetical protein D3C85_1444700 [compost metagenome]
MRFPKRKESDDRTVIPEDRRATSQQIHFCMTLKKIVLPLQSFGKTEIVRVHSRKVPATCQVNSLIETRGQAKLPAV